MAAIQKRIEVVDVEDLPVEIETDREIRVWHDVIGGWTDDDLDAGIETAREGDQWVVRTCIDDAPAGTLRICETVPVDEADDHDTSMPEPLEGADREAEITRAEKTVRRLEARENRGRLEQEKLERARQRLEVLDG